MLTSVAVEDRGGVSRILSTWLHLKSTVTELWVSIMVFSTTVEPNKLNLALPLITICKRRELVSERIFIHSDIKERMHTHVPRMGDAFSCALV